LICRRTPLIRFGVARSNRLRGSALDSLQQGIWARIGRMLMVMPVMMSMIVIMRLAVVMCMVM
jgi:hypothetical protein